MASDQLYQLANEWLKIDSAEQKLREQGKILREHKKELTEQLLPMLQSSGGSLGVDEHTRIECQVRKSRSLGKKNMIAILSEKTNLSEEKARALVDVIYNNRPEKEVSVLKIHSTLDETNDNNDDSVDVSAADVF